MTKQRSYPLGIGCRTAFSPDQTLFFVMNSASHVAWAMQAFLDKREADQLAWQIGGCVRVGHLVDQRAVTV